MTEEQIKAMADEYAAEYVPMYQKVAGIAFVDEGSYGVYEEETD